MHIVWFTTTCLLLVH